MNHCLLTGIGSALSQAAGTHHLLLLYSWINEQLRAGLQVQKIQCRKISILISQVHKPQTERRLQTAPEQEATGSSIKRINLHFSYSNPMLLFWKTHRAKEFIPPPHLQKTHLFIQLENSISTPVGSSEHNREHKRAPPSWQELNRYQCSSAQQKNTDSDTNHSSQWK